MYKFFLKIFFSLSLAALLAACFNPMTPPAADASAADTGGHLVDEPFTVSVRVDDGTGRSIAGLGHDRIKSERTGTRNIAQVVVLDSGGKVVALDDWRDTGTGEGTLVVGGLNFSQPYHFLLLMGHWERTYAESAGEDYLYDETKKPTLLMAGFTTAIPEEKNGVISITMYPIGVDTSFVKGSVTKQPEIGSGVKLLAAAWTVKWSIKGTGFINLIKAERQDAEALVDDNAELSVTDKKGILRIGDQEPDVSLTTGSGDGKAGRALTLDVNTSGYTVGTTGSVNFNLEYVPFNLTDVTDWDDFLPSKSFKASNRPPAWIIRNGVNDEAQNSGTTFETAVWDGVTTYGTEGIKANGNGAVALTVDGWDGKGRFVMVGGNYSTEAAWSDDGGETWNKVTIPLLGTSTSVTYGDGRFVALPKLGKSGAWSEDGGATWNKVDLPCTGNWFDVAYGGGRFVAVSYWDRLYNGDKAPTIWSEDGGETWHEAETPPHAGGWRNLAFGNNRFVTVSGGTAGDIPADTSNRAAWSADGGVTWNEATLQSSDRWMAVVFDKKNSKFITLSYDNFARSTNGSSWNTTLSIGSSGAWIDAVYGDYNKGTLVAIVDYTGDSTSPDNKAIYSTTGTKWTVAAMPATDRHYVIWIKVAYGGGRFIAMSLDSTARSDDGGKTWEDAPVPIWVPSPNPVTSPYYCSDVAYGEKK
jgi:hypothetical protein